MTLPKPSEREWLTRGWTLQELLAPRDVTFFDSDWNTIPSTGRLGSIKLGSTPKILLATYPFFKTTFIDKNFGDKVIDLAKKNKFYIEYFFIKVVVVKAQRVEKIDCFLCSVAYP